MIGGEFPITVADLSRTPSHCPMDDNAYHYASGRAALYQILRFLKEQYGVSSVLLPDYLCGSILVPLRKLEINYDFFPLNEQLEMEPNSFRNVYRKNAAVILINYFGLQDLSGQVALIRTIDRDAIIIEDDVQAFFEFKKPLGDVDFKYTSLRKTFAIPDGGLVKTDYPLPAPEGPNTFGQFKAAAALMKAMREEYFDDNVYLEISRIGSSKIDDELSCGISHISECLYVDLNEEEVKCCRQRNAAFLVERLSEKGVNLLLPIMEDKVPLFVPIVLDNRDYVRASMFQNEVFCPVHWPHEGLPLKRGAELAAHELSLIVDQRYTENDMDLIVSLIK